MFMYLYIYTIEYLYIYVFIYLHIYIFMYLYINPFFPNRLIWPCWYVIIYHGLDHPFVEL